MKKTTKRLIIASAATLLVSTLCIGSYAALQGTANISKEEAKEIALSHAGVDPQAVRHVEIDRDWERGLHLYEIEFYADGIEYEYEINADSGEILKGKIDRDDPPSSPVADNSTYIGVEKAKEIALTHAGLTADAVRFAEADLDRDDGKVRYEIEFYAEGVEYEYKIDATSGQILKSKTEGKPAAKPVQPVEQKPNIDETPATPTPIDVPVLPESPVDPISPEAPVEPTVPTTPTEPAQPTYIGVEAAKEIALSHAGLTVAEVRMEEAKADRDNGKVHYDIDFVANGVEYEYEIDALTGQILKSKTEGKPATQPIVPEVPAKPTTPTEPAQPTYIGEASAQEIALSHAGLTAADARRMKAEFDWEDGRAVYEVEFRSGAYEFEYEIDAATGKILDFEKEIDD